MCKFKGVIIFESKSKLIVKVICLKFMAPSVRSYHKAHVKYESHVYGMADMSNVKSFFFQERSKVTAKVMYSKYMTQLERSGHKEHIFQI